MQMEDLPQTELLGVAADIVGLETLLLQVDQGRFRMVRHSAPVHGGPQSVRVMAERSFPGSTPFPKPLPFFMVASELFRLGREEARYSDRATDAPSARKGWEIRQGEIEGVCVVVAVASWV